LKRGLQIAAACIVVLIGAFAVGSAVAGPFFWYSCSLDGLEAHGPSQASILLARDGTHLGLLGATGNRKPVSLERIDPTVRKAIVAVEDRRFYENNGIDYVGIIRALKSDVSTGGFAQGASTIEQQLVRNLYLTPQQTLSRKLTEACLAVQLDKQWSKDRILTAYLNDIYFGQQAYGIEAAANAYFGVHAKDLSLEQAALLAGLPQAPSAYDPVNRPDAAKARRAEVLRAMLQSRDITRAEYRRAVHSPLGLHPRAAHGLASQSYLAGYITNQLVDQYGAERVREGGLKVYTTLDAKMQTHATNSILGTLDRSGDPAGSVVSIDPKTGEIRAMAIAQTGRRISFDLPVDGRRQAGSTFKMFVLTQAVQRQINPYSTTYLSAPLVGPDNWHVHTFENTYSGRIPLTQATLLSDNTVYARLTLDLGADRVAKMASRLGVRTPLDVNGAYVPSIGLGSIAVTPLDMASAYATFAAGGVYSKPMAITKVVLGNGQVDTKAGWGTPQRRRVLSAGVAYEVTKILEENVQSGTGVGAYFGRPAAGKTGTTENHADAWFCGYTPQLEASVWVGYQRAEIPMYNVHGISVAGGTFPATIWNLFMQKAMENKVAEDFTVPDTFPTFQDWRGEWQYSGVGTSSQPTTTYYTPSTTN